MKRKMSAQLRACLAHITHGSRDPKSDARVFYHAYKLILKENFGALPAQRMLERAAELNYGPACIDLAMLYYNGRYINNCCKFTRDEKKMVEWLKRAADRGNPEACILMAHCCYAGTGIDVNERLAAYYIGKIDYDALRRFFGQSNCQEGQTVLDRIGIIPTQILYMQTLSKRGHVV